MEDPQVGCMTKLCDWTGLAERAFYDFVIGGIRARRESLDDVHSAVRIIGVRDGRGPSRQWLRDVWVGIENRGGLVNAVGV